MNKIFAQKVEEARTVGMIVRSGEENTHCPHIIWLFGKMARCRELPLVRVCVVTRDDHGSSLNPEAETLVPKFQFKLQGPRTESPQPEPGQFARGVRAINWAL